MKFIILISLLWLNSGLFGQGSYAPPVGQTGTKAMHKDSSDFVGWGLRSNVNQGPQNIQNTALGNANVGDENSPIGIADGNVVSLGDGGNVIVMFSQTIKNGSGNDFAVFENSFSDDFLELAFVEVSSDGVNFFRFPSHSETQSDTQIDGFGSVDATRLNNLAGKYKGQFGTPFDLNELAGTAGLDVNAISHVKIIDCIGSIDLNFGSFDSYGNIINEPYPTGFGSGGFDLDAIGVVNQNPVGLNENAIEVSIYPNPIQDIINVDTPKLIGLKLLDINGSVIYTSVKSNINTSNLDAGIYFLKINTMLGSTVRQIIKN